MITALIVVTVVCVPLKVMTWLDRRRFNQHYEVYLSWMD